MEGKDPSPQEQPGTSGLMGARETGHFSGQALGSGHAQCQRPEHRSTTPDLDPRSSLLPDSQSHEALVAGPLFWQLFPSCLGKANPPLAPLQANPAALTSQNSAPSFQCPGLASALVPSTPPLPPVLALPF